MRALIQRVKNASCVVDGKEVSKIDKGLLVFVGFKNNEDPKKIDKLYKKLIGVRIFEDSNGKMNLSIKDVGGSFLVISQFTLYGDMREGLRPSFTEAMDYNLANDYYLDFTNRLSKDGYDVKLGVFGADMKINLINDGPVTIWLDSETL
ncbi:MAG: D-tyrosyl-tRNA(Tyr) deacylase [Acholeplasmatales bacterium]|nr:D-tyrosyl-tRNA(Tyr) deacylase [Acholeplasmatales bacterium]